jgi:hypothetical protein
LPVALSMITLSTVPVPPAGSVDVPDRARARFCRVGIHGDGLGIGALPPACWAMPSSCFVSKTVVSETAIGCPPLERSIGDAGHGALGEGHHVQLLRAASEEVDAPVRRAPRHPGVFAQW